MARRRFPEGLIVPIDRLDEQGYGVGQVENRSIRLKNALPGEQATARILKRRRTELLGECHVWQNPNELRRHAPCEYFPRCGGCSLQHLNYADQLVFKTEGLRRELETCGVTPDRLMQPVAGPRFGYRHKARLSVRYLQGEMLVGFAETLSSRVGRMDACLNLAPRLSALIPHLKARLSDLSVAQHIPQVEVASGEQAVAIIIRHLAALSRDDEEVLRQLARSQGISVYLQAGGYDSLQKLFPLTEDDLLSYSINGFGLNLQFHPTEFTQVNPHMNCQLVADAVASCGDLNGVRVVDLFCGIGNFSLALARRGAQVFGYEGSAGLTMRAQANALRNGVDSQCEFSVQNLYDPDASGIVRADVLLLDPPRSGAGVNLVQWTRLNAAPHRVVYVSCNPKTFAADARVLLDAGYRLLRAGIYDMFPHTAHVETLGLFVR